MALYPCVVGSHRYGGRQQSAYLGLVDGTMAARSKQRLCPKHFQDLRAYCEEQLTLVAIGDIGQVPDEENLLERCACGEFANGVTAYANLYATGQEPNVYVGGLCKKHEDAWRSVARIFD